MDIQTWLLDYFSKKGGLLVQDTSSNYFELGIIDSLGAIELIEAIEETFNIQFAETHFQDRRFSTIDGLSEIILEIQKKSV